MKYQIKSPIKFNGVRYAEGDTIPALVFEDYVSLRDDLIRDGFLVPVEGSMTLNEVAAQAQREAEAEAKKPKTPDLQGLKVSEAVDTVAGIQSAETLHRLLAQENSGKNRKTVLDAIKRQIRIYG